MRGEAYLTLSPFDEGSPPDTVEFVLSAEEDTVERIRIAPRPPGSYRYSYGGRGKEAIESGTFLIDTYSREFSNPEPDNRLLEELGTAESAAYVNISELNIENVGDFIAIENLRNRDMSTYRVVQNPIPYMVILITLILEVFLRKRMGFS
jgi:hypothetical protein